MYVGALELDVVFGDVRSLKEKRSLIRPVVAELRRRFDVAAAEAGHADLHRRTVIGVAAVAGDAGHVREVLQACERLVAARPELELLAARRRMLGPDDDADDADDADDDPDDDPDADADDDDDADD